MRQLTGLDAQFLAAEDGRNHGRVSALGIYDRSTTPGGALTRGQHHRVSYRDSLDVGVVGDRELVPDAWSLVEHTNAELNELRGLLDSAREASSK